MPIYEYQCQKCQTKFEAIRSINNADAQIECKSCKSTDTRRLISRCYSKSEGRTTSSSSGCGGCSGGTCSSCGH